MFLLKNQKPRTKEREIINMCVSYNFVRVFDYDLSKKKKRRETLRVRVRY